MTFAYFTLLIFILLNLFCAAYAKKLAGFTPANNHDPTPPNKMVTKLLRHMRRRLLSHTPQVMPVRV